MPISCQERPTTSTRNFGTLDVTTESVILRGHDGPVTAVAITPDDRWLVTASEDATTHIWALIITSAIACIEA